MILPHQTSESFEEQTVLELRSRPREELLHAGEESFPSGAVPYGEEAVRRPKEDAEGPPGELIETIQFTSCLLEEERRLLEPTLPPEGRGEHVLRFGGRHWVP